MAGKNGFERYRIIDKCLRDQNKSWTKDEMLKEVNKFLEAKYGVEGKVTSHTIRHDLDTIEFTFGAEIVKERKHNRHTYRYENPYFSIFNIELSKKDITTLTKAMELLSSIKGLELAEEVKPIISFLQNKTNLGISNSRIMQFDHKPVANGTEHLDGLLSSIQQKTVLKINYKPYKSSQNSELVFHPYLLKEYNSRWFCLGYDSVMKKKMLLALDRIQKMGVSKTEWIENKDLDLDHYFDPLIGVTRLEQEPIREILLEFNAHRFPYVRSKPLHPTQTIEKEFDDGGGRIKIRVMKNNELISLLLSFGNDMKVIAPEEIKMEMKLILKEMMANYK